MFTNIYIHIIFSKKQVGDNMLKQIIFILLITISNIYFALINKNKKSFINILLIIISVGVSVFKSNLPLLMFDDLNTITPVFETSEGL